jgi:hypothetical protein
VKKGGPLQLLLLLSACRTVQLRKCCKGSTLLLLLLPNACLYCMLPVLLKCCAGKALGDCNTLGRACGPQSTPYAAAGQ